MYVVREICRMSNVRMQLQMDCGCSIAVEFGEWQRPIFCMYYPPTYCGSVINLTKVKLFPFRTQDLWRNPICMRPQTTNRHVRCRTRSNLGSFLFTHNEPDRKSGGWGMRGGWFNQFSLKMRIFEGSKLNTSRVGRTRQWDRVEVSFANENVLVIKLGDRTQKVVGIKSDGIRQVQSQLRIHFYDRGNCLILFSKQLLLCIN